MRKRYVVTSVGGHLQEVTMVKDKKEIGTEKVKWDSHYSITHFEAIFLSKAM
jgi:hypothetical protein